MHRRFWSGCFEDCLPTVPCRMKHAQYIHYGLQLQLAVMLHNNFEDIFMAHMMVLEAYCIAIALLWVLSIVVKFC